MFSGHTIDNIYYNIVCTPYYIQQSTRKSHDPTCNVYVILYKLCINVIEFGLNGISILAYIKYFIKYISYYYYYNYWLNNKPIYLINYYRKLYFNLNVNAYTMGYVKHISYKLKKLLLNIRSTLFHQLYLMY